MTRHTVRRLRTAWGSVRHRLLSDVADDRGDVPGWVLITLMTAGLVVVIWALAGPALADLFQQAIAKVSGL
ncbi:hypothetical protein [Microbacterium luticocti]|uniref:hypothetical protein n=1 Tax=Microbacterium luticocti TaxID=451764 RepID=UPI00048D53CE|nr:hypothetical protein [Microbacterium luticocti]